MELSLDSDRAVKENQVIEKGAASAPKKRPFSFRLRNKIRKGANTMKLLCLGKVAGNLAS